MEMRNKYYEVGNKFKITYYITLDFPGKLEVKRTSLKSFSGRKAPS